MLQLRFTSIMTAPLIFGPAAAYFFVGGSIVEHPSGRRVAVLSGHQWQVADRHYFRVDCEGVPSALRFVGPEHPQGNAFGPFGVSHAADGTLYGDRQPVARYLDANDRWMCTHDGLAWPVLVVEPIAAQPVLRG